MFSMAFINRAVRPAEIQPGLCSSLPTALVQIIRRSPEADPVPVQKIRVSFPCGTEKPCRSGAEMDPSRSGDELTCLLRGSRVLRQDVITENAVAGIACCVARICTEALMETCLWGRIRRTYTAQPATVTWMNLADVVIVSAPRFRATAGTSPHPLVLKGRLGQKRILRPPGSALPEECDTYDHHEKPEQFSLARFT